MTQSSQTLTRRAARTREGHDWPVTWPLLLRQLAIFAGAYLIYKRVRDLTEGSYASAAANAETIIELERRLGIYVEAQLQELILDNSALVLAANSIYVGWFWPVIIGVGIWLLRRRPRTYFLTRDAVLISGLMGFAIFALFPVAPPRLMDLGVVDTVAEHANVYRVMQPNSLTNQYAAVPSFHFGWTMLMGIMLVREATRPAVRAVGVIIPIAMGLAIVLTGNHFILDAVAGAAVTLAGLAIAARLRRWTGRDDEDAQPRPEAAPPVAA